MNRIACSIVFAAFATVAMGALLGAAGSPGTSSSEPPAAKPSARSADFVPRIRLDTVRFGFRDYEVENAEIFAELLHPAPADFFSQYDPFKELPDFRAFRDHLDDAIESSVFEMIAESRGTKYTIIEPTTMAHTNAALGALSYWFEGGGTVRNFAAVLDPETSGFAPGKRVFLVMPGAWSEKIRCSSTENAPPTEDERRSLLQEVELLLDGPSVSAVQFHRFVVHRDEPAWAVHFVGDDLQERFVCFAKGRYGTWEAMPADTGLRGHLSVQRDVLIEVGERSPRIEDALDNSNIVVLPDLDGNGCSELLLVNPSAYVLMSVRHESVDRWGVRFNEYHLDAAHVANFGC